MAQPYAKSVAIIYLTCTVLFASCVSLKQSKQSGIQQIDNVNAFAGVYENTGSIEDSLASASLWNQLSLTHNQNASDFKKAKIELVVFDQNKLKAIWWENDVAKAEMILKGKLKDNYFVSKHQRTIIPIPLIYGEMKNNQFQLSISKDNQLMLDRLQNQWGWVFLFLANNDSTKAYQYKPSKK